jgi:hypothetical protein
VARRAQSWIQISDGGHKSVILAVDFYGTGRREATFRDLVQVFPLPLSVWQTTQPPDSHQVTVPARRYLSWWSDRPRAGEALVDGVLGYCAGSIFASAIADELQVQQGKRPAVILFNPGRPTLATLERDFLSAVEAMHPLTTQERVELCAEQMRAFGAGEHFDATSRHMIDIYIRATKLTSKRVGLDEYIRDELIGLFRSYISYLRAARELEYRPAWASAITLTSADSCTRSEFPRTRIICDADRGGLLRNNDAALTAFNLLVHGGD